MSNKKSSSDETPISFTPITDGLGFHPFSDGLPYAPVSKNPALKKSPAQPNEPLSMGSGAEVGGRPRFSFPDKKIGARTISVPTVGGATETFPANNHLKQHFHSQVKTQTKSDKIEVTFGFPYLLKRVIAYFIDSTLNVTLSAGAMGLVLWEFNIVPHFFRAPDLVILAGIFLLVFNWALITAQEIAFSTSLGKRLFRLSIDGDASAIFLRAFFSLISFSFMGLGIVWAVFDKKRRCWHDIMVELQPLEIAAL